MSPGKARLSTGTCCVGTLVVYAGGMLFSDGPRVLFPGVPASASAEFLAVLEIFMGVSALMLPFDLAGGSEQVSSAFLGLLIHKNTEHQPRRTDSRSRKIETRCSRQRIAVSF